LYKNFTGIQIKLQGHLKILEYKNKNDYLKNKPNRTLLNKRNAIHKDNASILAIKSITNRENSHIAYMVFGNGGTTIDGTGNCVLLSPNDTGNSSDLYNPVFFQLIDDTLGALPGNQMNIRHISGTKFTDIDIRCLIDTNEPFSQTFSNMGTGEPNPGASPENIGINLNTDTFSFDEIGLKLIDGTLLTHVIFTPVLKTANTLLEIIYTIRIAIEQPNPALPKQLNIEGVEVTTEEGNLTSSISTPEITEIIYSMRLAEPSYTGPLFTLRRDSDNNTMDFYPDINGNPPTSDIATWLGSANAFVTVWYDQGGSNINVYNTDINSQPSWNNDDPSITIDGNNLSSFPPVNNGTMFNNDGATIFMVLTASD
jgi:hypothetical protein